MLSSDVYLSLQLAVMCRKVNGDPGSHSGTKPSAPTSPSVRSIRFAIHQTRSCETENQKSCTASNAAAEHCFSSSGSCRPQLLPLRRPLPQAA